MNEKSRGLLQLTFCHCDNQWLFVPEGGHLGWAEGNSVIGGFVLLVWGGNKIFM